MYHFLFSTICLVLQISAHQDVQVFQKISAFQKNTKSLNQKEKLSYFSKFDFYIFLKNSFLKSRSPNKTNAFQRFLFQRITLSLQKNNIKYALYHHKFLCIQSYESKGAVEELEVTSSSNLHCIYFVSLCRLYFFSTLFGAIFGVILQSITCSFGYFIEDMYF